MEQLIFRLRCMNQGGQVSELLVWLFGQQNAPIKPTISGLLTYMHTYRREQANSSPTGSITSLAVAKE